LRRVEDRERSASAGRTGQDLEGILGLVQALEAAQAARGAEAQREREVRQRLAAARAPAHAPFQPAHARLVRVCPLPAAGRGCQEMIVQNIETCRYVCIQETT
jgi:hypothetical protein